MADASPDDLLPVPPNDAEAEIALIGCLLLDEESAKAAARDLSPSDFYNTERGAVFGAIAACALDDRGVNLVTVRAQLETAGLGAAFHEVAEAGLSSVVGSANWRHYAAVVKDRALQRVMLREALALKRAALNGVPPAEAISEARDRLEDARQSFAADEHATLPWKTVEALASSSSTVAWLLRGYIGEGLITLLIGAPKGGKSTLLFGALRALETGAEEFIGQRAFQATAVYLSEEPAAAIYQKCRRFGIEKVYVLDRSALFPKRSLEAYMAAAVAKAREVGAKLIIVDTFTVWAGLRAKEENDSGAMSSAMEPVIAAASQGFAVVVVHHTSKGDGDGDGGESRGSSALPGLVDVEITVRPFGVSSTDGTSKTSTTRRAIRGKGRFEETPAEMVVDLQGQVYVRVGSAPEARMQEIGERVVAYLATDRRWFGQSEIVEGVAAKRALVLSALQQLVVQDRVRKTGKGTASEPTRYAIPGVPAQGVPS